MRFQILSIFPEMFEPFLKMGMLGRAAIDGKVQVETVQLRSYAINNHGQIDDSPYGGGSGMVLRPEPAVQAIEEAKAKDPTARVVLLSPRGKTLTQKRAQELADSGQGMIVLCSRYEGVDQRAIDLEIDVPGSDNDIQESDDIFTVNGGVGYQWMITDGFYIRPEFKARWFDGQEFQADEADSWDGLDTEYSIGIGWQF